MTPKKHSIERIKGILSQALDIEAGETRDELLNQACENDADLRKEVESLLEAFDITNDFLSHDASGGSLMDFPDLVGSMIGSYRLVERIGEGGFGEVYRAEQTEPLRRTVALKIIKLGMDTRNVIARFEAERQALARMNHPGIAQVYDAGATESGRPYFVMELIAGVPIIEYCDRNRLCMPDRIELFRQVCEAVQHAHQKGILHRDLKPSNILVSDETGKPRPKIIDFGIAKSLGGRLTEQTLATLQEMLIGTPMYMSPEQLSQDNSDIDTRSDIYSLGVILYELISGATPLEHKAPTSMTIADMRQALHERDLPWPSKRFQSLGRKTTVIANRRGIKPPALERLLRGDLDWVVMKAIEKERDRRYDDVIAFSEDLDRYLNREPVSAHRPSLAYRMRKFVRRHKTTRYVVCSVSLTVLIGVAIMTISFMQLTKEPTSIIEQRGWKLEKFYDMRGLGSNGFAIRSDGSVLIVNEWGSIPKGLYWAKKGGTWSEADAFSVGPEYVDPEDAVELPEGIYVTVNGPRGLRGKVLKVPTEGGGPELVSEDPLIRNPYTILVAPQGFDGPNVDPGDLMVFDLRLPGGVRAVNKTTGTTRTLISNNDNTLVIRFVNGCFAPNGALYVGFLKQNASRSGACVVRISTEGKAEFVLDDFLFPHLNNSEDVSISAHPITGELFFCAYGELFAFVPGKTEPSHVMSRVIDVMHWAADGSRLYLMSDRAIWTLSGPDIENAPVSEGNVGFSTPRSTEDENRKLIPSPLKQMRDAVLEGDVAMAKELVKTNSDLINSTEGNTSNTTPLHLAAWYGRTEFAAWLLENTAAVDVANRFGNTPLHLAAAQGQKEIVLMLLEHGSPLNTLNGEKCTPLDYARSFDEIADILRRHGAEAHATAEYDSTDRDEEAEALDQRAARIGGKTMGK